MRQHSRHDWIRTSDLMELVGQAREMRAWRAGRTGHDGDSTETLAIPGVPVMDGRARAAVERVARTIADTKGHERVGEGDLADALEVANVPPGWGLDLDPGEARGVRRGQAAERPRRR